jgi:hypothetical protein
MAINDTTVRAHIRRALGAHAGDANFLRRLTKAFRLVQAERRDPASARDENLAAAEHYLFARQAVASNVVSLTQMLLMVAGGTTSCASARSGSDAAEPLVASTEALPSQDSIGWGVAGAMVGETDRLTWLPGSTPPPFKPTFMRAGAAPAAIRPGGKVKLPGSAA